MLKNAINGLDNVFYSEVPKDSIILVTGAHGTLKSTFVMAVLSKHLATNGELGMYLTLEQAAKSHIRNLNSLGIKLYDGLHIVDLPEVRRIAKIDEWFEHPGEVLDFPKTMESIIRLGQKNYGEKFTCLAVDSLNALYSLINTRHIRTRMYHFFDSLRVAKLTAFIIRETPKIIGTEEVYAGEHFLADGVINLGIIETPEDVKRYIQVEKMRATYHSTKKHELVVVKDGLAVRGPIYEK